MLILPFKNSPTKSGSNNRVTWYEYKSAVPYCSIMMHLSIDYKFYQRIGGEHGQKNLLAMYYCECLQLHLPVRLSNPGMFDIIIICL